MDAASRLERIVGIALGAQALAQKDPAALDGLLAGTDPDFVGFAIEGASMGLTMLSRADAEQASVMDDFRAGPWSRFAVLMHAGAGLALGELAESPVAYANSLEHPTAGFVIDGYGFHLGFVAPGQHLSGQAWPHEFDDTAGRVLDNGLARAIWFGCGGDAAAVVDGVSYFDPDRRGDLWAGVGFAATYAGGLSETGLALLVDAAGAHRPSLAAGSALAAHVRVQCDNPVPAVDATCQGLTGRAAAEADSVCTRAADASGGKTDVAAFVAWRDRVRDALA